MISDVYTGHTDSIGRLKDESNALSGEKYKYARDEDCVNSGASIVRFLKKNSTNEDEENISVFKFADVIGNYAVPLMRNIDVNASGFRMVNENGLPISHSIGIALAGKTDKYAVLNFSVGSNSKICAPIASKYQPRWLRGINHTILRTDKPGEINFTLLMQNNEQVAADSESSPNCVLAAKTPEYTSSSHKSGLQAAVYWRIDDLPFDGKYKIRPRFSFRVPSDKYYFSARAFLVDDAGHAIAARNYNVDGKDDPYGYGQHGTISLTRNKVEPSARVDGDQPSFGDDWEAAERLLAILRNLLVFESEAKAKYIYLQLFFDFSANSDIGKNHVGNNLAFAALPAECEREADIDKISLIGFDARANEGVDSIIAIARRLCLDYGINTDEQSFADANAEINALFGPQAKAQFIPFKQGDNFPAKLEEICRATNVSMFSDGSKLYAKYFFSSEPEWIAKPEDVIKGSLEVRSVNSVATEWEFSANVQGEQKTLSINDSFPFPESEPASAGEGFEGYVISYDHALFVTSGETLRFPNIAEPNEPAIIISPLSDWRDWREVVCGNLDAGFSSAKYLWDLSRAAFKKIKKRAKLDERYTKHQIAAFGTDQAWLQSFLQTATHNSFAKTIISFKVPIDRLPKPKAAAERHGKDSLSGLLLKRITLAFGRFGSNPLDGWIVGYSLAPAENAVRIEFINSEPVKQILWLDENLLNDQLIVDEREKETAEKFYSEN